MPLSPVPRLALREFEQFADPKLWRGSILAGTPMLLFSPKELGPSVRDVVVSIIGADLACLSSQSPLAISSALMLSSFHQATSLPA